MARSVNVAALERVRCSLPSEPRSELFRGRYEHAIDKKGRTSLPSRFREVLGGGEDQRLILTSALDPCLVAYPMAEWLDFEAKLAALPQFDASVAMLRRLVVSGAVEVTPDKMGRIPVPASLRTYAGFENKVVWAGMGRHIELWAQDRFDAIRERVLASPQERAAVAARLAELGL